MPCCPQRLHGLSLNVHLYFHSNCLSKNWSFAASCLTSTRCPPISGAFVATGCAPFLSRPSACSTNFSLKHHHAYLISQWKGTEAGNFVRTCRLREQRGRPKGAPLLSLLGAWCALPQEPWFTLTMHCRFSLTLLSLTSFA